MSARICLLLGLLFAALFSPLAVAANPARQFSGEARPTATARPATPAPATDG